VKLRNLNIQVW